MTARLGSATLRDRHALLGTLAGSPLVAIISAERCSDGMSDRAFGLAVDAVLGEDVLSGCCSLAPLR